MRTSAARPHLVPAADTVGTTPWQDTAGAPLADRLAHWDSATDLILHRVLTVDTDQVRQQCQLTDEASLAVTATWYSATSRAGGALPTAELGQLPGRVQVPLNLAIPGRQIAGSVRLRTRLILRFPGPRPGALSPISNGAILWSEETVCAVEGSAGQFPVAVVDFTDTDYPDQAAWALSWGEGRLHEPVLGDFRLLLNSGHPTVVDAVLTGSNDPAGPAARSMLRYEVMRSVVYAALSDDDFCRQPDQYDKGTVGDLAAELVRLVFDDADINALAAWLKDRPDKIDAEVQSYTGLLA